MTNAPANYDLEIVQRALLEIACDAHPTRLTISDILLRVAADPHDPLETETIEEAARELRRRGVLRYRNDEGVVEMTQAALRVFDLVAR